ncbi:helix-turn-helix domain-containing protein [Clostridium sp. YIM B02569]|uniref:helix-turn-helix transcriptional regulator n=1 Tax=Clostridium sp. YIM B02569 TaxID=2911967 RepID=UPI001EEA2901
MRNGLIELRGDRSRQEIAQKLKITPQMLGSIERASRNPSLELAVNIAKTYNITLDKLIFLLNLDT